MSALGSPGRLTANADRSAPSADRRRDRSRGGERASSLLSNDVNSGGGRYASLVAPVRSALLGAPAPNRRKGEAEPTHHRPDQGAA
jgi:hypothetical protein